jgi:general secretion pathway protein D
MNSSTRKILLTTAAFLLAAALPLELVAQTVGGRPGSTARGTNRGGATTRSSTLGGSSSSGGPRQYRSNTELGDATIQIDPETRSLVIVTDDETNLELMKVIKMLDRPKPQVLIKVVFVEVTYNKDSDIGVEASLTTNWGGGAQGAITGTKTTNSVDNFTTPNGGTKTVTSNAIQDLAQPAILANGLNALNFFGYPTTPTPEGAIIKVLADDWTATLHALQKKGKLEVISRPSIMARNNQEAVIVIGSEVPFVTNSQITNLGQTINTITYDNVGVILRVTPFITSEGTVEMIVAPEISTLTDQTVPISNTASAPVIAKRSAETVVVTPNGRTVVIGGLMQTQKTESIRKIPLLGDIPWVGAAFRRTIKGDEKKELLIFLTPYIVNSPEGLDAVSNNEVDRTELIERAFTPDQFGKYVDDRALFPETLEPQNPEDMEIRRATVVKKTTTVTKVAAKPAPAPQPAAAPSKKAGAKPTPAPVKKTPR